MQYLQTSNSKEIDVGHASELFIQVFGEEGNYRVLRRSNLIGTINAILFVPYLVLYLMLVVWGAGVFRFGSVLHFYVFGILLFF